MAIIRHLDKNEFAVNYITTIGFFCVISCTIIMLRFRGFKASLNFISGKSSGIERYDKSSGVSLTGAYRTNKDEQYEGVLHTEPLKTITPSMVKLPANHSRPSKNHSKSTSDLTKPPNEAVNLRKSTPNITQITNPGPTIIDTRKQKKLEKQRLAEQKKQEKLAAKERQREEKMRKERERHIQQTRAAQEKNNEKKPRKRTAPQPQAQQTREENNAPSNSRSQVQKYPTNTLESSISKSSGPPPYSSAQELRKEVTHNTSDDTGNTSFAKPVNDMSSWDMITQHRQQMSRQPGVTSKTVPKRTHIDLHYKIGSSSNNAKNHSET